MKQIKFKPTINSDKVYTVVICNDNDTYLVIGDIKTLDGQTVRFPPLMVDVTTITANLIIHD